MEVEDADEVDRRRELFWLARNVYDDWDGYSSNGDGESFMGEDAGDGSDSQAADDSPMRWDNGGSWFRAGESPRREEGRSSWSDELRVREGSWYGWNKWPFPTGEEDSGDRWDNSRPDEYPTREDAAGSSAPPAIPGVGFVALDKLDCVVCHLPLKPPIYQCSVGHVVCSPCCDKRKASGTCHICRVANGGYRRCHAMECMVESVHVQCPYAAHGCTVRPTYYDQQNHSQRCAHAPCHCPEEACGFIGSKAELWRHFSSDHSWPCSKGRVVKQFDIDLQDRLETIHDLTNVITLHDGFNFLLADCASDSNNHGANSTATANIQYLFLLNVACEPRGRVISMICVHPHAVTTAGNGQGPSSQEVKCELLYTRHSSSQGCDQVIGYYQKLQFRVACSDLSNGLASLDGCCQFVIPDSIAADIDGDAIVVTARIIVE